MADQTILVTGATGHLGGAVARHLLAGGWHVRALTRDATSAKARALGSLGAQVVQGDMGDIASLRPVVDGVYGVFSVQNPMISGLEAANTVLGRPLMSDVVGSWYGVGS